MAFTLAFPQENYSNKHVTQKRVSSYFESETERGTGTGRFVRAARALGGLFQGLPLGAVGPGGEAPHTSGEEETRQMGVCALWGLAEPKWHLRGVNVTSIYGCGDFSF